MCILIYIFILVVLRNNTNYELHLCVDREKEMGNPSLSCDLVPKLKVIFGGLEFSMKFYEVQR